MVYTPDKGTNCSDNEATWEHVLELSLGGSNTLENTSVICHACNSSLNSVLHIYLSVDNASFGGPKWKEIFVQDKMNLVKLHRYLEWKMNAIFQGKIDGNEHLSYIWKKSRFRGGRIANNDEKKRNVGSSERRGWMYGIFRRIHSFFRVKNRMSPKSNSSSFEDLTNYKKSTKNDNETESSGTGGHVGFKALEQPHLERAQNKIRAMGENLNEQLRIKNMQIFSSGSAPNLHEPPKWSDLDKENEGDLLNLLVSLIGDESVTALDLGKKISAYQRDNELEKTGTRVLIASFGFSNISLPKLIQAEFSEHISAEVTGYGVNESGGKFPQKYAYSVKK